MTAVRHRVDVFVELSVVAMRFLLNSNSKLSMCEMRIVFLLWIKLHNISHTGVVFQVHISSNVSLLEKKKIFHICCLPVFGYNRSFSEMLSTTITMVTLRFNNQRVK